MSNCYSRRDFIKTGTAATLATTSGKPGRPLPVIVCSRGEKWGRKVLGPAWKKWQISGNMLDAVEEGANIAEADPEDNSVGLGGLPNEEGVVELDASIMCGPTHNCGAVAGIQNIKFACSVARLVMERTDHMMLVGKGAEIFAVRHGFQRENLLTEQSRREWLYWKENLSDNDDWLSPDVKSGENQERPTGTINVLGIDDNRNVFGITTTSGLAFKIAGRVGDSPIIGAGLYLDNKVGAAGATGRGEEVIRTCGSFFVVEKMREGKSPEQACKLACQRILDTNNNNCSFNVKFIAVNRDGHVGCAQLLPVKHPNYSFMTPGGFKAARGFHF